VIAKTIKQYAVSAVVLASVICVEYSWAQGMQTFLDTRGAIGRMVPGAAKYNVARFTPTEAEVSSAFDTWGYELSVSEQYLLFFGWNTDGTLSGVMYVGSHEGKHGPIRMAIGLTPAGVVRDLAVMEYQEVRGRPVREQAYLNQYIGKSIGDPIALGNDISGLTGASFSSRAVTAATKEAVVLFTIYVQERQAAAPPAE
jgi:hypothetical protein